MGVGIRLTYLNQKLAGQRYNGTRYGTRLGYNAHAIRAGSVKRQRTRHAYQCGELR